MKKFISLMNPYSFYYIWNSEYQYYLVNLIKTITNIEEEYKLLNTFNKESKNLKSYIFLESDNYLIFIDFNNTNTDLINYLKLTSNKNFLVIIFNLKEGKNYFQDNIYNIYKNRDNDVFLKFLLSKNFKEQQNSELKDIFNYIYNLDDEFYFYYLKEENYL